MIIPRRRFLKILVITAGATTAGYLALRRFSSVHSLYVWLTSPFIKESPTGSLNSHTLQTLLSITETLTEASVEKSHYENFFRWRSENLRGYKDLYKNLTASFDRSARELYKCDFVDCDTARQRKIFENMRPTSRLNKLRMGIFEKDWLLFEKYIFPEILLLFTMTDAWIVIGYESWPGKPRGLIKYTQSPLFLTKTK